MKNFKEISEKLALDNTMDANRNIPFVGKAAIPLIIFALLTILVRFL
ncbi:MAG: hypothetical protein HUJ72_10805 [Blautia sp.]|nr:hypothetical protein [Blautia sp.]